MDLRPDTKALEQELQTDASRFYNLLAQCLQEERLEEARNRLSVLLSGFVYGLENHLKSAIQQATLQMEKVLDRLLFVHEGKPGFYVLKGQLEALVKIGKYMQEVLPDAAWFVEIGESRYNLPFISFLHQNHSASMSSIANHLDIHQSYATKLADQLETKGYVKREYSGKMCWCSLTKKGMLLAKHYNQQPQTEQMTILLREWNERASVATTKEDLDAMYAAFVTEHPEWTPVLREWHDWSNKVTRLYQVSTIESNRWNSQTYSTRVGTVRGIEASTTTGKFARAFTRNVNF